MESNNTDLAYEALSPLPRGRTCPLLALWPKGHNAKHEKAEKKAKKAAGPHGLPPHMSDAPQKWPFSAGVFAATGR